MKLNQHHIRYLRKKQNEMLKNELEPPDIWMKYWLNGACSLLNVDISTDNVLDMVPNFFENRHTENKNIGNICAGLTILSFKTSNKTIYNLNEDDLDNFKKGIKNLFKETKNDDDTYSMYKNGETDTRSIYCSLVVANHTGIRLDVSIDFLLSCQTYDGGFGGIPDSESHAGFTYCAVASLALSKELHKCNMVRLVGWLACRAEDINGRISTESDSCYAYWIGATVKILEMNDFLDAELSKSMFDCLARYVMSCEHRWGGFSNKAGEKPDLQHTACALFFLSLYDNIDDFSYTVDPLYGFVIKKS